MNDKMQMKATLASGQTVRIYSDRALTSADWLMLADMCTTQGKAKLHYIEINGTRIGTNKDVIEAMLENPK